jgi:predicted phage tail protein
LDKWLLDSEKDGVSYRVSIGKEKLDDHNFVLAGCPYSEQEVLSITPILAGAGGAGAQIGIGVGLIALSFLLPGAGAFGAVSVFGQSAAGATIAGATAGAAWATSLGTAFSLVGASLVLGGIAQAISPSPINSTAAVNPMERGREAAKFESFSFSGIVNTAKQGLPVPIAYGRLFVGSAVLSSGLDVDQIQ